MQKLELEVEAIQISIYTNIVLNILKTHGELSVNKILLFSYLIKKRNLDPEKYILRIIHRMLFARQFLCFLDGEYTEYCENVKFILKSIHLLIINRTELNGCLLSWINGQEVEKSLYQESPFVEKAIEESVKKQMRNSMKEVISNV